MLSWPSWITRETFNRLHRVPSLAANHPKYKDNGRYWQGGVWPGANYMVDYRPIATRLS